MKKKNKAYDKMIKYRRFVFHIACNVPETVDEGPINKINETQNSHTKSAGLKHWKMMNLGLTKRRKRSVSIEYRNRKMVFFSKRSRKKMIHKMEVTYNLKKIWILKVLKKMKI